MIENYGTGIARILESYKSIDGGVIFNATNSFFEVTMLNLKFISEHIEDATQTTVQTTVQTSVEAHKEAIKKGYDFEIKKIIDGNKNITLQEIADRLGLSRSGVKYHINKLKSDHQLVRIGSDNSGHWGN